MPERDEKGLWLKGTGSPNPGGRPKFPFSYDQLMIIWGSKPLKQLRAIMKNQKKFEKLNGFEAATVRKILGMSAGRAQDVDKAFEGAWDRIQGKAQQSMAFGQDPDLDPLQPGTVTKVIVKAAEHSNPFVDSDDVPST